MVDWKHVVASVAALAGCQAEQSNRAYKRVTITLLGSASWTSMEITPDGSTTVSDITPGRTGNSKPVPMSKDRLAILRQRLEPYFEKSRSYSTAVLERLTIDPCEGAGYGGNDGARFRIDWYGKGTHRFYWLDSNCRQHDQKQVSDLSDLIDGLPPTAPD